MMTKRYEIRDNHNPTWRGQRFTKLAQAEREFKQCVGVAGRWTLLDRETGKELATR